MVNIACGLDTRFQRLDDGHVTWYDLDLPDVIELRRRLLEDSERHRTIAASALDPDWPDQLGEGEASGDVLVIIEGLSMYLEQDADQVVRIRVPLHIVNAENSQAVKLQGGRVSLLNYCCRPQNCILRIGKRIFPYCFDQTVFER